jgi:hypothetical protein
MRCQELARLVMEDPAGIAGKKMQHFVAMADLRAVRVLLLRLESNFIKLYY